MKKRKKNIWKNKEEDVVVKIPVKTAHEEDKATETQKNDQPQELQEETITSSNTQEASQEAEQELASQGQENRIAPANEEIAGEQETPSEEDEVTRLKKELEAREQDVKEHYDARLRLQAEFDNFKKRKERESLDFRRYANEDFIRELLVVVDDFERAIAAAEQTHKLEDFLQGVELIFDKFLGVLKKKGIKEIEAEGQPFNPEIHEAVTQIETDDVEEGTVVTVFQKGYYLHDRVIVAPKVGVAKQK